VDHEIPKIDFPNISLPIDGGPGSGNVYAYNLKLQKFKSPTFKFALSPPSSITWQSDNGYIKLSGRWKADYTVLATLHLNGWVEVITKGIRSTLSLGAFGQDGHPQIEVHTCDADILELHMSLGGGVIQWIVNLFKEDLSYAVKSAINQQVHSQFNFNRNVCSYAIR
jgi:hypothetical protein